MNTLLEFSISTILAGVVVLIHYEALRLTSLMELNFAPRKRILVVICAAFIAHLIEITLYGLSYLVIAEWIGSALIGLMMITWTASFTYLNMEKFWKLH